METKTKTTRKTTAKKAAPQATTTPEGDAPGGGTFIVRPGAGTEAPGYDPASPNAALRGEPVAYAWSSEGLKPLGQGALLGVEAVRRALRAPAPKAVAALVEEASEALACDRTARIPMLYEEGNDPRGLPVDSRTLRDGLDVLAALYDTAEGYRLLDLDDVPYGHHTDARAELRPAGAVQPEWKRDAPAGVWEAAGKVRAERFGNAPVFLYRCALTRRYFVLPQHAPVPCLVSRHNWPDEEAGLNTDDVDVIHPALFAAGPEAIGQAIYYAAYQAMLAAADALNRAREWFALGQSLPESAEVPISGREAFVGEKGGRPVGRGFVDLGHKSQH